MQHRIRVSKARVRGIRSRDRLREQGRQAREDGADTVTQERRDLQPTLPDDWTYSRRRETPA